MDRKRNYVFIITIVSVSCIAMVLEGSVLGWEYWVPPLAIVGTAALWVMQITGRPDDSIKEICYLIYTMLAAFFHGVHETSFFDVAIVISFVMVAYSLLDHIYMMNVLLVEYFVIIIMQLWNISRTGALEFDFLNTTRLLLHIVCVIFIYFGCVKSISGRLEAKELSDEKDERIRTNDQDMEDFLSNISHELRTPVNVISGMSDILLKKGAGEEVLAIKDAEIRLAGQIEDIQDYTETSRDNMILEEEDYMSTSLINDVVTSFRMNPARGNLEMIVDLSPYVPTMMRGDVKKLHKIFRHLLENSIKYTKRGGIIIKVYTENTEYGVNLCVEVSDTGIGMGRKEISSVSKGMYQANKKRDRSSGGVGLGLSIVYGFAHRMGGFVKIESNKGAGTTVRVTIPQKVVDMVPCLKLRDSFDSDVIFHVKTDKFNTPKLRDFYRSMAVSLAADIRVHLYPAETLKEVERLIEKLNVGYIFMGAEEYEENPEYFDELSRGDMVVAVSAPEGFKPGTKSRVIVMPKPLYAYPIIKILNEGKNARNIELGDIITKPDLDGVRALVVDDEPMNLIVATGLFRDYGMITDTAESGKEAVSKFSMEDYDIVFMDHMMPEMDGVEAMRRIRNLATEMNKSTVIVALTANVVSGAREMFMREGFDGFIGKPIDLNDFERVMNHVLPKVRNEEGGETV